MVNNNFEISGIIGNNSIQIIQSTVYMKVGKGNVFPYLFTATKVPARRERAS